MEDALTEAPPPSRFFNEDLNNFISPSPPLPSPFLVFSNPNLGKPLRPSLIIIAISNPSLHLLHHLSSKTLIGTLILPEIPLSGNSIEPSLNKSCNIYSINDGEGEGRSVLLVLVQIPVAAERAHAVAKVLINGDSRMVAERVLVLDSIESMNFRGKLPPDETFGFKLETLEQRKIGSMVKGLEYFPSGSVIDGLAAAILARCQIKRILGTLVVSWPQFGYSAVSLIKSVLVRDVLSKVRLDFDGLESVVPTRDPRFDSELYT